ncbi:hypothetical protein KM043_006015 [Ampulex compressa]|nr:hypothetical protein KM043_006015 [Ampulex compressa]
MSFSRVIARSFSSTCISQQMVKPPIQVFGLEGRYATALYSAASKQKTLDGVEKDLLKFQDSIKTNPNVMDFLNNPSIKRKDKVEALKAICSKASVKPETANVLTLLAENGRLSKLNQMINTFKLLMSATRGEVVCEVITAKPMDADMKSGLESALKGFLKKGDKYVDMSTASKVKKYSDILTQFC